MTFNAEMESRDMSHGFSWLHLSDLHFRDAADGMPPTLSALLADLEAIRQPCGPWDAVFISGDLTWSGQAQQFEDLGRAVLDPLWKRLEALGSGQAVLLAVPGNHDLQRRPGATLAEPANTPIPSGASGFEAYARWWGGGEAASC